MEYALRVCYAFGNSPYDYVLILVLMEYALRAYEIRTYGQEQEVLILVLMEYALRDRYVDLNEYYTES